MLVFYKYQETQVSDSGRSVNRNHEYDLRKFYFPNRVVNTWNSVSSYVVSANTLNCFKSRLDK